MLSNIEFRVLDLAENALFSGTGKDVLKTSNYSNDEVKEWNTIANIFAANMLSSETNNVPTKLNTELGIFWKGTFTKDKADATKKIPQTGNDALYLSYGFIEDVLFNTELGKYTTSDNQYIKNEFTADSPIQYDSSEIYNMSNLKDYSEGKHNEDTYFAQRCRHSGFKIKHNHKSVAFHDDPTYTNLGRYARRRENGRTQEWVKSMDLDFPPEVIVQFSAALYNSSFPAEAADVLRMGLHRHIKNQILEENWKKLSDAHGGELSDARWSMDVDPLFLKTINWIKK